MQAQHFTSKNTGEGIEVLEKGKKLLFYQLRPKSVDGKYERAGYVHPLYDLNENSLTDDMPADHLYHRGIFWAWHQIVLNGKNIADGWTSENISFRPVRSDVKVKRDCVIINSELNWDAKIDNEPAPVVKENTTITVFRSTPKYRIIDFTIKLTALRDSLMIGGSDDPKGYGGFCLRLKLPKDIQFMSGNKKVEPRETAVLAGPWMDFSGSFQGESSDKSGIAVFGYPPGNDEKNPWILRKATSMQNIPDPGRSPYLLPTSGHTYKYRVVIHNKELTGEEIENLYQEYARKELR